LLLRSPSLFLLRGSQAETWRSDIPMAFWVFHSIRSKFPLNATE
jgi:hypothetical protein